MFLSQNSKITSEWVPTHVQTDLHKQTCASPFFGVIWREQARFLVVCASILAQTTQILACSRHITPKKRTCTSLFVQASLSVWAPFRGKFKQVSITMRC